MQFRSGKGQAAGLIVVAIVFMSVAHPSAFAADRIAGTKVALEPPPGFTAETQFPGFRNVETGATIMVTEIPGPIDRLRAGLTKSGLAGRGMTLHESSETKLGGQDAQLIRVSQSAGGVVFEKWILVFGTATDSVFIVATYPESEAKTLRDALKKAVLSARWNLEEKVDQGIRHDSRAPH